MHGPKSVCGHETYQCRQLKRDNKRSYCKPSKWNQEKRKHKHFSKEEVKALFDKMYSHSAKKRAVDRKKTQEELRVFENLKVESEYEKEENPFKFSDEDSERSDNSDSGNSEWKIGQSLVNTNDKIENLFYTSFDNCLNNSYENFSIITDFVDHQNKNVD